MFKIVKGAVEGKKGKEAIVETMRRKFAMTKPPDHVRKVLYFGITFRFLKTSAKNTSN
jgi:hypothetical protein